MVAAALAELDGEPQRTDVCLAADFHALGLCHLLTEVLTVQMRYTSLLDEERFQGLLLDAAAAALSGEEPTARVLPVDRIARSVDQGNSVPSRNCSTRSAYESAAEPCVTTTTVPPCRLKAWRCRKTSFAFSGSRLPVGSSANRKVG